MPEAPVLIVFLGGMGGAPIENQLADALAESALDLLDAAIATDAFERAILVTGNDAISARVPVGVTVDRDSEPFQFGNRLAALISQEDIERPLYVGAGGVPLMSGTDLAAIANHLRREQNIVISNNFFSADLVAFTPGSAIEQVDPPPSDNYLPRLLHDQAGLKSRPLPRGPETQFNIDSPADLAILKVTRAGGPKLAKFVDAFDVDLEPYRRLSRCLVDPQAELLLAGRVGSQVWPYLESETACRLRVYSEERGMRAAGRDASGKARSLLAFHLREVGCQRFFAELGELADAACIDTRPMLSHLGVTASRADRFWSDLGRPDQIEDAFLKEFTQAATDAPIPVLLGGHSLIAGGLMLLNEAAWREEDKRLLSQRSL
ncbi:MAG: hypothetical protein J4N95_01200 [Chloroflexi bacterium]|nr:hypothetical protein [Chloroflexota bacterium]MCI0855369.1 hypothetical protein [Chloroflexota bacterium]MCI0889377.1 hypothetical protein [Chloroflexota bacterium]